MANERVEVAIVGSNQTDAAFREVESNLGKLEGRLGTLNSAIAGFAGGIGAGLVERLADGVGRAIKFVATAAEDAAVVQRKLEAVLKATGNASGFTADQLDRLAASLARGSSFDDEQFKEATTTILRFGNIAGENLERVLRLSGDYAAITGGSLTSAAQSLARALNDPATGLKKLERNFGDLRPEVEAAIKEMERAGDRSGAIALALSELEKKIGGADAATNKGVTAAFRELKKAISDLVESVGSKDGGALATFINNVAASVRGLNESLSATNMDKLRMLALVVTNPTMAGQMFGALGNRPVDVGTPSTAGLEMTDNERARRLALRDSQEEALRLAREQAKERERLAREAAREEERLRQLHVRGTEAALQAEHDLKEFWMKAEADLRLKHMRERQQLELAQARFTNDQVQKEIDLHDKRNQAVEDGVRSLRERVEQMELENSLLGLSNADRARAIALHRLEALGIDTTTESAQRLVDRYRDAILAQEQLRNTIAVWDEISSAAGRFFSDLIFNGRSAFDNLKTALKSFAAELVAVFAKRWVLQTVASATGSTALSAAAGQVGQGSLAGTIGNALLGGSGIGLATGAEFLAGMTGTFMGPTAAGSAASMGASFAAFMTNPATLAVLAAVVIAVAVMSRRGGPKEGGSAFGTFDENGNFVPGFAPGTQNGRFYTPSGADSAMVAMTEGIGTAFAETLARLGGTGNGFGFGFGFDRDPRGTANSRVSGVVTNSSGQTILEVINREAGRSEEDLQQALELLGRQSLLAALQNSELPQAVLAILRTVDAASAAAEDVDAVLQLADAFVQFTNSLQDIDVASVLEGAGRSAADTFRLQGQALLELANRSTITTQSLAQLTEATGAYRLSAAQLIVGLEQARRAIDEMFGQTRRNILMAGLDEQGRYNFLQDEAARLFELISGASSADEITRLAQQINENINAAFNLLSPEQQAELREEFLTRLENVNSVTQERLRALQEEAAAEANRQLAEVRRIMEEMALAQQAAANTQQDAADTQLAAANTPRTLNINVDLTGGGVVVTDGG